MQQGIIPSREEVIADPSVHNFTKIILEAAADKDCVDAYYDVLLAAKVLEKEMKMILHSVR